jgi:hypothetical protein
MNQLGPPWIICILTNLLFVNQLQDIFPLNFSALCLGELGLALNPAVTGIFLQTCSENKQTTPSPPVGEGRGEGGHTMITPTHAPRRVHDCPEPYMVQGLFLPHQGGGSCLEIFIVRG